MDHTIDADHLTSLYVPALGVPVGAGYVRFHQLARTLREQCPWDVEQTHRSLVPYLIEESYEVVDAIQALDTDEPADRRGLLIEELGDLLYQIEFHATIAEQEGRFTIDDVTRGIHDKLVRRHPHVFGDEQGLLVEVDGTARGAHQLGRRSSGPRRAERRCSTACPGSLPSLSYAHKVQKKAAKVGFDWPSVDGALPKIAEEAAELVAAIGDRDAETDELGDLLFAVVNVARHLGVDPESALRGATNKFRRRFESVEQLARDRGIDLHDADLGTLDALWDDVKRSVVALSPRAACASSDSPKR